MKRKAIIMGATSGIGREVAKLLLNKGWEIGITGRRKEELIKFQQKAPDLIHFKAIEVLSLKVCKLFFSFILVISIFLYFLPTFELVYFSFVSPFSFLHCYGSQEKDDRLC